MIAHIYTQLHGFCVSEGFPSPPPPMKEIISMQRDAFQPAQRELETILVNLSDMKKVRQPPRQAEAHGALDPKVRKPSSLNPPSPSEIYNSEKEPSYYAEPGPQISSVPSDSSLALSVPDYNYASASSSTSDFLTPAYAPAGPTADYFTRNCAAPTSPRRSPQFQDKKKPPPPPPKRHSSLQDLWVTALYDFSGQGQGDLKIKEGDRIRVTKRTESKNDWWEGELNGVAGSFPANYCQA